MATIADLAQALYDFWGQFGVKVYPNQPRNEPNGEPKFPFILYNINQGLTLGSGLDSVKIYDKTTYRQDDTLIEGDYSSLYDIVAKINDTIGEGVTIPVGENSNVVIWQIEWQYLPDTETTSAVYGNLQISYNL